MSAWKDILGTVLDNFRIGLTGNRLKSQGVGRLQIRNNSDTAHAPIAISRLDVDGNDIILGSEAANTLTLRRNSSQSANVIWTFPTTAGTAGQVFSTDGNGNIALIALAGGADKVSADTTSLAFGDTSPKNMFTLPANAVVNTVRFTIDTAFNGTPTASIGISGSTSKYVAATMLDLKQPAGTVFEFYPGLTPVATTEALQISYAQGGATAGTTRIEVFYDIPN